MLLLNTAIRNEKTFCDVWNEMAAYASETFSKTEFRKDVIEGFAV